MLNPGVLRGAACLGHSGMGLQLWQAAAPVHGLEMGQDEVSGVPPTTCIDKLPERSARCISPVQYLCCAVISTPSFSKYRLFESFQFPCHGTPGCAGLARGRAALAVIAFAARGRGGVSPQLACFLRVFFRKGVGAAPGTGRGAGGDLLLPKNSVQLPGEINKLVIW